jgi:hypothetical protein
MKRDWLLIPGLALLGVAIFALFGLNRRVYVLLDEPSSPTQVQLGYPAVIEPSSSATIQVIAYLEPEGWIIPENSNVQLEAGLWTSKIELSPPMGKRQTLVSLDDTKRTVEHEWIWTARPSRTGKLDFILRVKAQQQDKVLFDYTHTFKITVLDLFGLDVGQARALGSLSGLLGGALAWLAMRSIWADLKQGPRQQPPL